MGKIGKLFISGLIAIASVGFGATISHADEVVQIAGNAERVLSDQDQEVAVAAQETYGYSFEQAAALWSGSSQFSADCNQALELDKRVLDCSWSTTGDVGVGVWVYSRLSDVDQVKLTSKPYKSQVVVRASEIVRDDLDEAMEALSALLSTEFPNSHLSLIPDYAEQSIAVGINQLSVESSEAGAVTSLDKSPAGLSQLLEHFAAETGIQVRLDPSADASVFGGLSQETYSGGLEMADFGCTAGFTVKDAWGQTGIATARHCVDGYDSIAYAGNLYASSWHMLDYLSGDVAYAAVVGEPLARFQSSLGVFTSVTGYKNPVVGELVCHFGVVSGKKCATVAKVNVTTNFSTPMFVSGVPTYPKVGGLWVTNANVSAQGDSGGPWFIGGVLVGIHSGNFNTNGQSFSAFTRYGAINLLSAWAFGT